MLSLDEPLDCPECGSAGTVYRDFCDICDAEFGETRSPDPAAPSILAAPGRWPDTRILHPSIPVRFTDVVNELREISELAAAAVEVEGSKLAAACRRGEAPPRGLACPFLRGGGLDPGPPGQ